MMRWKRTLLILLVALAAALTALLASPGARCYFRSNRVTFLKNSNHFLEALNDYDRLMADFPGRPLRLPKDFRRVMVQSAADYYLQRIHYQLSGIADYEALLDAAAERPDLAPLARQKRLELCAVRDGKSSATLQAAREILNLDGFDAQALWWTVLSQYDLRQPLKIPPDLHAWREKFLENVTRPGAKPSASEVTRTTYLKALLALADLNWAEAADFFERYRRQASAGEPVDLAQGLALLKAGRPDAATQYLRQHGNANKKDPDALAYLAEAYLCLADYAWAANFIHGLRVLDPLREDAIIRECLGVADETRKPSIALCASIASGGAYYRDVALWSWLGVLARTDEDWRAIDAAADNLVGAGIDRPDEQAQILQYCLWRNRPDAAARLIAADRSPASQDGIHRQAMERILQWYPTRGGANPKHPPLASQDLNLLLTSNGTQRFKIDLPQGASMAVFMLQGYPAQNIWPIAHVDLGLWGSKTFYVYDSRAQAQPFVMALRDSADRKRTIEAAISLLNGSESGVKDRNVMIAQVHLF